MAEHIDSVVSLCIDMSNKPLKDVPMEQSTEQPMDMLIEQLAEVLTQPPKDVPTTDMLLEQQPTEELTEQPTDMPMEQPKEQSMDMHYSKVKPNMSEMATLEGLVFKDIILKSRYKQTKCTSVATSHW